MKYVHGLIAGHGGINPQNGEYATPGKRAKIGERWIYEGVENRMIKETAIGFSVSQGVEVIDICPGWYDTPLSRRVMAIAEAKKKVESQGKKLLIWELHLNAFNGKVSGREVFTTERKNFSDTMAQEWMLTADELVVGQKRRVDESDGDLDKERNFYVIDKSPCFGCLIEFYFFDNPMEVKRFANPRGRALLASTLTETFKKIDAMG